MINGGGTMETFKGTLEYSDLEGGVWVLKGDDGKIYHLQGGPEHLYKDGKKVTVSGKIAEDIMGIGMMGPVIKVKEAR